MRVRQLLSRSPTIGELFVLSLMLIGLIQILQMEQSNETSRPYYQITTRQGTGTDTLPISAFHPWQSQCHAVWHHKELIRQSAIDQTQRQWKATLDAFANPTNGQVLEWQKELGIALTHFSEHTVRNDGSPDPEHVVRTNYMDAIAEWLQPEFDRTGFQARPAPIHCTTHAIVMIEGRITPRVAFVIRHTFYMLRTDPVPWALIIFHTSDITEKLVDQLQIYPGGAGEHIQLHLIDAASIDRNMANQLVMSPDWWSLIPVETILLLQSDVLMMKPPSADLTLWTELTHRYVYVGGLLPQPGWIPTDPKLNHLYKGFGSYVHTMYSGNGGCSIRRKSAHLELLRSLTCASHTSSDGSAVSPKIGLCTLSPKFPLTAGPDETVDEDRWVGWRLWIQQHQFRGQLATQRQAQQFAVDSMIYEDPFFTHKYWQTWSQHNTTQHESTYRARLCHITRGPPPLLILNVTSSYLVSPLLRSAGKIGIFQLSRMACAG